MTELSLELCQWLKEKGFPQDAGEFYYYESPRFNKWELVRLDCPPKREKDSPNVFIACPTLEPLLEWAKDKIQRIYSDVHWVMVQSPFADYPYWSIHITHEYADDSDDYYDVKATDLDVKVAIVKLLKEVL